MAVRPLFLSSGSTSLVDVVDIQFSWHAGFAPSQKAKNRDALHLVATNQGYGPILEVSSKSNEPIGRALSAFQLTISVGSFGTMNLESAFQGSKVFGYFGASHDLYGLDARAAKKAAGTRNRGDLIGFDFEGVRWELEPKTAFYDWLYLRALSRLPTKMLIELTQYRAFTDIEFNPATSFNCQARSCALAVTLLTQGSFRDVVSSRERYIELLLGKNWATATSNADASQGRLL